SLIEIPPCAPRLRTTRLCRCHVTAIRNGRNLVELPRLSSTLVARLDVPRPAASASPPPKPHGGCLQTDDGGVDAIIWRGVVHTAPTRAPVGAKAVSDDRSWDDVLKF